MSKHLKSFIIACLVACMTVCLGIFAAACTNGDDGKFPESVSVTVMLDENTPAEGVTVQICATGEGGMCLDAKTDAQGVATIEILETDGKNYEVHILNLDKVYPDYQYVDASGTPYEAGKGIQIDVTKTSTLTITLKAKPVETVGTKENPLKLTLGADAVNFSVNLVSRRDLANGGQLALLWEDVYNIAFTTSEAGSYKITVTASLTGDGASAGYTVSTDETDIDYPTFSNGVSTLRANTEYIVELGSSISDYTGFVSEGTTSLSYTVKVEYGVGDNSGDEYTDDLDLVVGENKRVANGGTFDEDYYFLPEADGNYTITVDEGVTLTINGEMIEGTSTTVNYNSSEDAFGWGIAIKISKNSTITITAA